MFKLSNIIGCLILLSFLIPCVLGQTPKVALKTDIVQKHFDQIDQIISEIIKPNSELGFSFDAKDPLKYDDMPDSDEADENYLDTLLAAIKIDSNNAVLWNTLAVHYNDIGASEKAINAYTEAFNRLRKSHFENESQYYSFRALLKSNLSKEGALDDFEKALALDQYDSLAVKFYPLELIKNEDFHNARAFANEYLLTQNPQLEFAYILLMVIEVFEFGHQMIDNNELKAIESIDLSELDKIASRYKDNFYIQTYNQLIHILKMNLIFLWEISTQDLNPHKKIKYKRKTKKRLNNYIQHFEALRAADSINSYSSGYILANLYLINQAYDKALQIALDSRDLVPKEKSTRKFNGFRMDDLILNTYLILEKFDEAEAFAWLKYEDKNEMHQDLLNNLALIALRKKEYEKAKELATFVIEKFGYNYYSLLVLTHLGFETNNLDDIDATAPLALDYAESEVQVENILNLLIIYGIKLEQPKNVYLPLLDLENYLKNNKATCKHCDFFRKAFLVIDEQ